MIPACPIIRGGGPIVSCAGPSLEGDKPLPYVSFLFRRDDPRHARPVYKSVWIGLTARVVIRFFSKGTPVKIIYVAGRSHPYERHEFQHFSTASHLAS
jgi:hypothetical protein